MGAKYLRFSLVLPRMARIENDSISNHVSGDMIRATAVAAILRGNVSRLKNITSGDAIIFHLFHVNLGVCSTEIQRLLDVRELC